ncbi:MAG: RnfABCDGE type electron transport complex subunit C [Erysipelotrichaceae bacterium]
MSLFMGKMRQHIEGHKEMSLTSEVLELKNSSQVFIPLYAGHSLNFDVLVNEGDHVAIGTKIAQCNDRMIIPLYASVSGTVKGIQKMMHSSLKQIDHLVIENDGKDEMIQSFDPIDYTKASKEALVDFMKNAGIIGLGGAGFPTYIKYKGTAPIDTILINAVECEPYITSDYKMIKQYYDEMMVGIKAMMKMANANTCKIAIKKTKKDLIEFISNSLGNEKNIEIALVPDAYPMGWEKAIVRFVTKKDYDKLPSEVGIIVNNASTAIAFGHALTSGMPICERMITVSGTGVKNPGNAMVRVGTPVSEVIAAFGGYTSEDVKLIAGGPMMGKTIVNDKFVIDRSSNAITVLKTVVYDSMSCLRCGSCSDHCPVGLQPVRIAQALKANDKDMMKRLCADECMECGLCTYVCPSYLDVTENVRKVKRQLALMKK